MTTDIESQEFCHQQNQEIGYVENPCTSETDDLKCFYGMCHTWLGPYFTPSSSSQSGGRLCAKIEAWKHKMVHIFSLFANWYGF